MFKEFFSLYKIPHCVLKQDVTEISIEVLSSDATKNTVFLPASLSKDIQTLLYEKYQKISHLLQKSYYLIKPILARRLQLNLRRRLTSVQRKRKFPAWPIEDKLMKVYQTTLQKILNSQAESKIPMLGFWPLDYDMCVAVTHDVETEDGFSNIRKIVEIEKDFDIHSSFEFVPEKYKIDYKLFDDLKKGGFEIALHGLKHDGKLFNTERGFRERLKKIYGYAKEWGVVGFRSPSLHRNAEWMKDLDFEWDSSFPDTDPYEPQPGGCCSVFPFFLSNKTVELPVTLPQDHTLFEILKHTNIDIWKQKIDYIESVNGLVNVIIHPDYMFSDERLDFYRQLLEHLKTKKKAWFALPREIAEWWRQRDATEIKFNKDRKLYIDGPAKDRVVIISRKCL